MLLHALQICLMCTYYRNIMEDTSRCTVPEYNPNDMQSTATQSYTMVTACPFFNEDEETKLRCEAKYNDVRGNPSVFRPVSNPDTLTIYSNKYCAECHGDMSDSLTHWNVDIHCENGDDLIVHAMEDIPTEIEDKQCKVVYKPRDDDTIPGTKMCNLSIDRCNVSGQWNHYDTLLETHCLSYTSIYKGHKNVHCYQCNGYEIDESTYDPLCVKPLASVTNVSFEATIDIEGLTKAYNERVNDDTNSSGGAGNECAKGSKYDAFTKACIPLHCSRMMYLRNGSCVPFYTTGGPMCFHITFRMYPINDSLDMVAVVNLEIQIWTKTMKFLSYIGLPALHSHEIILKLNKRIENISSETTHELRVKHIDIRIRVDSLPTDINPLLDVTTKLYDELTQIEETEEVYATEFIVNENDVFKTNESVNDPRFQAFPNVEAAFGRPITAADDATDGLALLMVTSMSPFTVCRSSTYVAPSQFCPKVVVEDDHFVRESSELGVLEIRLLGQNMNVTDVLFIDGYKKALVCEETYFDIVVKAMEAKQDTGVTQNAGILRVNIYLMMGGLCVKMLYVV